MAELDARLAAQEDRFERRLSVDQDERRLSVDQEPYELPPALRKTGYDLFVSHAKKLEGSEDRAVWVADGVDLSGSECTVHGSLDIRRSRKTRSNLNIYT